MMMKKFKKLTCILVLFFLPIAVFSQLKNSAKIIISDGWMIKTTDYSHQTGGNINLDGTLSVSGDWQNNSGSPDVFTIPADGYVFFEGTGTQTVSQTTNFKNVELGNAIVLTGTMNIEGIIKLNDKEISGTGNFYLLADATGATSHADCFNGNLINSGTVSLNTAANYKFDGGNIQQTGSLLPATINNLIVDKTANNVTLSRTGLSEINGTLEILAGSLIANTASEITIGGNTIIGSNNGLILKSDINSTASLIDNGTISGVGSVKVEKFLPTGNVYGWTVASPIASSTPSIFTGHDGTLFYNPLTPGWEPFTSGTMDIMRGYWTRFSFDKKLEFSGNLNTGDVNFSDLYRTGYAQGNMGWNFIGNPFPSAINWDEVVALASNTTINSSFYETTKLKNQIHVSDTAGGYHAFVDGVGDNGFNGVVPTNSGFWVQVYAGPGNNENIHATNPTAGPIYLNNSVRVHQGSSGSKKSSANNLIRLQLSNGNLSNNTVVRLRAGATFNFDPAYDATKMFSQNANHPQIYSILDNDEKLAINAIPENFSHPVSIPLGFRNKQGTQLSITANNLLSMDANISIHLEDMLTNNMHDLRNNNTYTFSSNDTLNEQRFVLHLALINSNIQSETITDNIIDIYAFDKNIYVSHAGKNAILNVFNMMGQEVLSEQLQNNSLNKISTNLQTGLYIIKITNIKGVNSKKVFIQ